LGVTEACSGVRSITALTAIAAFVAYQSGFGFLRGVALLALSVPVIAAVNATRVVVTGLIQEHIGIDYTLGEWHEALGIGMVLLGLTLVVGLAKLLGRRAGGSPARSVEAGETPALRTGAEAGEPPALRNCPALPVAAVLLAAAGLAAAVAEVLGRGLE